MSKDNSVNSSTANVPKKPAFPSNREIKEGNQPRPITPGKVAKPKVVPSSMPVKAE